MRAPLAAIALLLCTTGCLTSRSIRSVTEHGSRNLTLVRTEDRWTYVPMVWVVTKNQFWSCRNETDALVCAKACDSKTSDLACFAGYGNDSGANTATNTSSQ